MMILASSNSTLATVSAKANQLTEQLDVVKQGAVIVLRNAHSAVYNEHIRVEVDRWGKVEASKEKIATVNPKFDVSAEAYELAEKSTRPPRSGRGGRGGRGRGGRGQSRGRGGPRRDDQ